MTELLPCPSCNGTKIYVATESNGLSTHLGHVHCRCGMEIWAATEELAVKLWNQRPRESALREQLEQERMPADILQTLIELCDSARSEADAMAITYQSYSKRFRYLAESVRYTEALSWLNGKAVK